MTHQFSSYQQGYQAQQGPAFNDQLLVDALDAMQQGFTSQDLYWIHRHAREEVSTTARQHIDQERLELERQAQAARATFQQAQSDLQQDRFNAEKQNMLTQRWMQWMDLKGRLLAMQEKAMLAREDMDERQRIAWQQVRDRALDAEARREIQTHQGLLQAMISQRYHETQIEEMHRHNEVTERNALFLGFQRHQELQQANQAREVEEERHHREQEKGQQLLTDARIDDITDQQLDRMLKRGSQNSVDVARINELRAAQKERERHNKEQEKIMKQQRRRGGCFGGFCGIIMSILMILAVLFVAFTILLALAH